MGKKKYYVVIIFPNTISFDFRNHLNLEEVFVVLEYL